MKLSKKMIALLNDQMNMEYQAAINYLAMSNYAKFVGMDAASMWLDLQHQEEIEHGEKLRTFLLDNGVQPILKGLDTPPNKFEGIIDVLKVALDLERDVTASINNIMKESKKEEDYRTEVFIGWYVTEQIEEETSFETLIEKCVRIGEKDLLRFEDKIFTRGE